jgi:hypothetical protein
MPYDKVKQSDIRVYPLSHRKSKTPVSVMVDPETSPSPVPAETEQQIDHLADTMTRSRNRGASVMLAFGAHLIKNGAAPLVNRLMETGWITHIAGNGACGIHDWEFAFQGKTEEDVRENVAQGRFGSWDETGRYINLAVLLGALEGMGYGESLGAFIHRDGGRIPSGEALHTRIANALDTDRSALPELAECLRAVEEHALQPGQLIVKHPHKSVSVFAEAYRLGIPATIHPGIGYDIIYNHPLANGAVLGRAGHIDYRIFVQSVSHLTGGTFLSIGSAIMAPQIFEKALSFANNLASRENRIIQDHLILVDDLQESVWDWSSGEPPKTSPDYYLRFLKSFHRMGGETRYLSLDNRTLLHHLYHRLRA